MRTLLIGIVSFVSLVAYSPAGSAASAEGVLKLSKPGVSYVTFMNDRTDCLTTARRWRYDRALFSNFNFDKFANCMRNRGYQLDANGFRAACYSTDDGKTYALYSERP